MNILEGAKLLSARLSDTPAPDRAPAPTGALLVFDWCSAYSSEAAFDTVPEPLEDPIIP